MTTTQKTLLHGVLIGTLGIAALVCATQPARAKTSEAQHRIVLIVSRAQASIYRHDARVPSTKIE
jgi:hypothetical protein